MKINPQFQSAVPKMFKKYKVCGCIKVPLPTKVAVKHNRRGGGLSFTNIVIHCYIFIR